MSQVYTTPFSQASLTAVVSDLHLCEEEPLNLHYPLWKKYKTRKFFFDEEFCHFLQYLHSKSEGKSAELILNGDIFDFDSVTGLPDRPPYRLSNLERAHGLRPEETRSEFKLQKILKDHQQWVDGLCWFLQQGHRLIFIIGNHDVELYWPRVQEVMRQALTQGDSSLNERLRFCEWFYISNQDTLVEHGNQHDPYCVTRDPVNPFVKKFNRIVVRLPFGSLTTRYLINRMGFFNPHVDSNFIMSAKEYVNFFFRYMFRAQPFLMLTWFTGSCVVLIQSFFDQLLPAQKDPLTIEDRVEAVARKANATPRMVRELKELFVAPAASDPLLLVRELWLDRAFILLIMVVVVFQLFLLLQPIYPLSFFWFLIPFLVFLPFFMFYSKSVHSGVVAFKEPQERVLALSSMITGVNRIVYGHTHIIRHELIGPVEHLNSGTWSPAFLDVECEKPIGRKTCVLIQPSEKGVRKARLMQFVEGRLRPVYKASPKI
jgi:UDP-2,3-diacylglucosamine pyrophosphatase LpxH